MAETTQKSAPRRRSRLMTLLRWACIVAAVLIAGVVAGIFIVDRMAAANIHTAEHVDAVRYLDQGWGAGADAADRQLYYYTPQGTSFQGILLRYSWLVHLERPLGRGRFADPDYMRSLGLIVDLAPTPQNPDQLPVGFARRWEETVSDYVVDLSCSACHTGELNVTRNGKTTAIRIDGGVGMHAFQDMKPGHFGPVLMASLAETWIDPAKFNRFARRVLGPSYPQGKSQLSSDLFDVIWQMGDLAVAQFRKGIFPVQGGFGRIDALAGITNAVFGDHIDRSNWVKAEGPVNFPYLWNIWKFDWVQYNASVSQPMARNVGEALGTGAVYTLLDRYGRPVPENERYRTSALFDNLVRVESTLQKLTPPRWPEDLLGAIDQAKAARGKALFQALCVGCHGPHIAAAPMTRSLAPARPLSEPAWLIRWKNVKDVGTDPNAAINFVNNRVDLSKIGLDILAVRARLKQEFDAAMQRQTNLVPDLQREIDRLKASNADAMRIDEVETQLEYAKADQLTDAKIAAKLNAIDLKSVDEGTGLTILGMMIRDKYYTDRRFSAEAKECYEGFGTLDLPQAVPGYKPRPLEGVWATPPFLHNGSVPTIYELLSPVPERSPRFPLGRKEFDPVKVGYDTAAASSNGFWYDTSLPGNRNTGHEFRASYVPFDESKPPEAQYQGGAIGPALTPDQRMALVEYLKIHRDAPDEQARTPPDCVALLKGTSGK